MTIVGHSKWQSGIYNFSNEGEISWYEFVLAIQEIGKFDCLVKVFHHQSILLQDAPFSLLDKRRLKIYGVSVPDYEMA
jgi:dTDP-4-dehydrorhamnose reductase